MPKGEMGIATALGVGVHFKCLFWGTTPWVHPSSCLY